MTQALTPKNLVEGFLRAADPDPISVKSLLKVGELLGFSNNAIRVAISRLCAKELVVSDARSCYRLTDKTFAISKFIERWRIGEDRVQPWQGQWLCCHLPQGMQRTERNQSQKSLTWHGFKNGLSGLYLRPDNLNLSITELSKQLIDTGLTQQATLFRASDFSGEQTAHWPTLWDTRELESTYQELHDQLCESYDHFHDIEPTKSLPESLILGGNTLRALALDPLLPQEMVDISLRQALTAMMIKYEQLCRTAWGEMIQKLEAES